MHDLLIASAFVVMLISPCFASILQRKDRDETA